MADSESPQNLYAKNLRQTFGYPLRYPEPKPGLPASYAENGLHIGDVGYVDEEGMFIVRFNICSSLDHDLHQARRADLGGLVGLTTFDPNDASPVPSAFSSDSIISHGIRNSDDKSIHAQKFMTCSTSGAILILPSGALRQKLDKAQEEEFRKLAEKHALGWSRVIDCTSLYLVTGFYKAESWYLASFHTAKPSGEVLLERDDTGKYTWSLICDHRGSPRETHNQNQTVLVTGFKIEVREWDSHIWVERLSSQSSVWSKLAFLASSLLHILVLFWKWIQANMGAGTRVNRALSLSPPFHPSDIINHYLLHKNSNVRVAITHDSQWLSMLEENEISHEDMVEGGRFLAFLEERYTDDPNFARVAYLQRKIREPPSKGSSDPCKLAPSPKTFSLPPVPGDTRRFVVAHMRAENSVTHLRRVPVGFYVLIQFNEIKRRSKCKPVSLYNGPLDSVIEWEDEIVLPTDPTTKVEFSVHASFEFEPIVGNGEVLCVLKRSIGNLAQAGSTCFVWDAKDTSSCASLLVTIVERQFDPFLSRGLDDGDVKFRNEDHLCVEVTEATDKGHNALLHFYDGQGTKELEKCVEYFSLALDHCPSHHECYAVVLFNFATAKFRSCQAHGTTSDLDAAINSYRQVLRLRPFPHPDRPGTLLHLAQALLYRDMKVQRNASVTDEIKQLATEVQDICSQSIYDYQAATPVPETLKRHQVSASGSNYDYRAATLLLQTLKRYQILASGNPAELDELISELKWSAHIPPSWCLDRPYRLANLSAALSKQFEMTSRIDCLQSSISALEQAVELIPDGHFDKPWMLASLGDALRVRFVQRGIAADLRNAISMIEGAVKLTPHGHFDKPWMLASLGAAIRERFLRRGVIADLDNAISMIEDAVELTPNGHFDKPWLLTSLGDALRARFVRRGAIADLDKAVSIIEDAIKQTPDAHLHKPWMLASLSEALYARFIQCNDTTHLDNAISTIEDAVKRVPDGYLHKPWMLASLSDALYVRFTQRQNMIDLDSAISTIKDAMKLASEGRFDKHPLFPPIRHVVFIGEVGSGKSSLINLIAAGSNPHDLAPISSDGASSTAEFVSYDVSIEGKTYRLWNTPGLRSFQKPRSTWVPESVDKVEEFLHERRRRKELDLLLLCVRGTDRSHTGMVTAYNQFCRPARRKTAIPVGITITHLENEQPTMDAWWQSNERTLGELGLEFDGHACVTCLSSHQRRSASYGEICSLILEAYRQRPQSASMLDLGYLGDTENLSATNALTMNRKSFLLARQKRFWTGSLEGQFRMHV